MASTSEVGMVALVLALGGARCSPSPEPPDADSGCSEACANLVELGCPEGEATADGATCEDVCGNGMAQRYDLGCVAEVVFCDLAECESPQ